MRSSSRSKSDEQFLPDVALGSSRFLTAYGHGGTSEPPFELRAKVVRHDTRVEDFVDITRAFEAPEASRKWSPGARQPAVSRRRG